MLTDYAHASFQPQENCTLWRYIDFTKFVSLIESQQLIFSRADQFEDPYEGELSSATVRMLRDPQKNGGVSPHVYEALIGSSRFLKQDFYISCWHASEHESAAMWKLYLKSDEGVAIRTDFHALRNAIEQASLNINISLVKYVDYGAAPIPCGDVLSPFLHKRLSFSHEQELRALIWRSDAINAPQIPSSSTITGIPVPIEQFIKAVHVCPTAPPWFGDLVEKIARTYNVQAPIIRSNLYERPAY